MSLISMLHFAIGLLVLASPSTALRHDAVSDNIVSETDALLEVFQVYPPPLSPTDVKGATACSFTLMHHVFGNSAGNPFVGTEFPLRT
jgi:hypothetical protein